MRKVLPYLFILFFMSNCVEEIDIKSFTYEDNLVVEAFITNELKYNTVKLQRTIPLDTDTPKFESNAIVTVVENNQTEYSFSETSTGIYTSNIMFKAKEGNTYQLKIKTTKGDEYESSPQKIEGINDIDNIIPEVDFDKFGTEGAKIVIQSQSSNKDAKYYRYSYEETYKIIAPRWSPFKLTIVSENIPFKVKKEWNPDAVNSKVCYKTLNSTDIIQAETNTLIENNLAFPIKFIDKEDFSISRRYSILVKQYVQSYEGYTYYKTLNKLSSSSSVFTSNQPGFIPGNINHVSDTSKKVLGFFEVNSVSEKRIFFNHIDLFPRHSINFIRDCNVNAPPISLPKSTTSPLIEDLKNGRLYFKDNKERSQLYPGNYLITDKKCGDCRVLGTNVKPVFWID